jgi:hypothetical protein
MGYTNANLIASIKVRASVPENQGDWSDQKILDVANDVLRDTLVPFILAKRSEFYVFDKTYTVTQNQAKYRLPSRAIGATARDLRYVRGTSVMSLPQIDREEVTTTSTGVPRAFYLQSNYIVLYQTPASTSDSFTCPFFIRPNALTEVANCVQVTAINALTNTLSVAAVPTTFTVGTVLDLIKGTSSFESLAIDQTILTATSTDLMFTSIPTDVEVGDWLSLAGYACVPQIPEDLMPVLAQGAAVKILESLGQVDGAQLAQAKFQEALQQVMGILSPRITGEPRRFTTSLI